MTNSPTAPSRTDLDGRTPVIVGVGQSSERITDPGYRGLSPVELAAAAAYAALEDTGVDAAAVAAVVDTVAATRQFENSTPQARAPLGRSNNFPRSVANRVGVRPARAILGTIGGQTPQQLVTEMCRTIAAGHCGAALVFGAEAISTIRHVAATENPPDFSEQVVRGSACRHGSGSADPVRCRPDVLPDSWQSQTRSGLVSPGDAPVLGQLVHQRMGIRSRCGRQDRHPNSQTGPHHSHPTCRGRPRRSCGLHVRHLDVFSLAACPWQGDEFLVDQTSRGRRRHLRHFRRRADVRCVAGMEFRRRSPARARLVEAVQRRCQFEPGELIVGCIESQPIHKQFQEYVVIDAAVGVIERGRIRIADLVDEQPWLARGPIPLEVTWRRDDYRRMRYGDRQSDPRGQRGNRDG